MRRCVHCSHLDDGPDPCSCGLGPDRRGRGPEGATVFHRRRSHGLA